MRCEKRSSEATKELKIAKKGDAIEIFLNGARLDHVIGFKLEVDANGLIKFQPSISIFNGAEIIMKDGEQR